MTLVIVHLIKELIMLVNDIINNLSHFIVDKYRNKTYNLIRYRQNTKLYDEINELLETKNESDLFSM